MFIWWVSSMYIQCIFLIQCNFEIERIGNQQKCTEERINQVYQLIKGNRWRTKRYSNFHWLRWPWYWWMVGRTNHFLYRWHISGKLCFNSCHTDWVISFGVIVVSDVIHWKFAQKNIVELFFKTLFRFSIGLKPMTLRLWPDRHMVP